VCVKTILFGLDQGQEDFQWSLSELKELAKACNLGVTHVVTQKAMPQPATYMGKGKIDDIKSLIDEETLLVCDGELTATQSRNLSDALGIAVRDRTDLILQIFASRARTKEAVLQVEVARLEHSLSTLAGSRDDLTSQQGGMGFRGGGEKQIELDRRRVRHQIARAKKELSEVKSTRATQRARRKDIPMAALCGYTNSGKSTLMNTFTHKKVSARDRLFETLETSTRRIDLQGVPVLLTDTVGFVSHLPHHLIESFLSTLEEVKEADLIVLVCDITNPEVNRQIDITEETLKQLGVEDTPVLYVYNKVDLIPEDEVILKDPHVIISAKEETGLDELKRAMARILFRGYERLTLHMPYAKAGVFENVRHKVRVVNEAYNDDGLDVIIDAPAQVAATLALYRMVSKHKPE